MKSKLKRKILMTVLCIAALTCASGSFANAGVLYGIHFDLKARGEKASSGGCKKEDSKRYATMWFNIVKNPSTYPLYLRLRSSKNNTAASDLQQVVGTGERYVPYYSGYGQKGYSYYIRMQTDSASSHGASVRGGWYP